MATRAPIGETTGEVNSLWLVMQLFSVILLLAIIAGAIHYVMSFI